MKFAIAVFVAILATGALAIAWSWSYSFTACAVEEYDEFVKLAVDHYSNTVERLLTLSTALVALGSAVPRRARPIRAGAPTTKPS